MAVCSFIGHEEVYDADIESRVQLAIDQIVESHDSVEFLIYPRGEFYKKCLLAALKARTCQPQKVTITHVNCTTNEYTSALSCMADKTVILHFEPSKKADAALPHRKMVRWIVRNSTHLVACVYDWLYDPDCRLSPKKSAPEIINIATPETKAAILRVAPLMKEREQIVFQKIHEGHAMKEVGKALDICPERVRQILWQGGKTIRKHLRRRYHQNLTSAQRQGKHTCGLFALGEVTPESLERFKRVVDFLATAYGVNRIYVDQAFARSDYIFLLAKSSQKFHITAMVYDQLLAGSGDTLNDLAKLLCPPCHAMGCVSYADPKSVAGSFGVIADLMERMDFCICDLSTMPHAERIRAYAAYTRKSVLLDMSNIDYS